MDKNDTLGRTALALAIGVIVLLSTVILLRYQETRDLSESEMKEVLTLRKQLEECVRGDIILLRNNETLEVAHNNFDKNAIALTVRTSDGSYHNLIPMHDVNNWRYIEKVVRKNQDPD